MTTEKKITNQSRRVERQRSPMKTKVDKEAKCNRGHNDAKRRDLVGLVLQNHDPALPVEAGPIDADVGDVRGGPGYAFMISARVIEGVASTSNVGLATGADRCFGGCCACRWFCCPFEADLVCRALAALTFAEVDAVALALAAAVLLLVILFGVCGRASWGAWATDGVGIEWTYCCGGWYS